MSVQGEEGRIGFDVTAKNCECIVDDIYDIVRQIRFPDWQSTEGGKREVRKALRRTLAKYKFHTDTELFEKAYGYVKEYY